MSTDQSHLREGAPNPAARRDDIQVSCRSGKGRARSRRLSQLITLLMGTAIRVARLA
jgi:hypothetical protein